MKRGGFGGKPLRGRRWCRGGSQWGRRGAGKEGEKGRGLFRVWGASAQGEGDGRWAKGQGLWEKNSVRGLGVPEGEGEGLCVGLGTAAHPERLFLSFSLSPPLALALVLSL